MTIWYIVLLGVLIFLCFYYKIKIHWKTFFKRGFLAKRGPYGTRCFYGPQGSSKTLSMVSYLFDNKDNIFIFSNVKLNKPLEYVYFNGFEELIDIKRDLDNNVYDLDGKQVVIVFDELFTELTKGSRLTNEILDLLCQLRKRKIILLTSCQSWPDLPLQFRRLTRYAHKCRIISIPFITSFQLITVEDAENMRWDEVKQDFVAPICWTDFYHTRKEVANCYDTSQRITK